MSQRKVKARKKQRALNRAGIVHASGWINERDKPTFDALCKDAQADVEKVEREMEEGEK